MSETYARLLSEWKQAGAEARALEEKLNEAFDAFVLNGGPEPPASELERLGKLRQIEAERLQLALEYVRRTALGPR